jgi:hypothetical protein
MKKLNRSMQLARPALALGSLLLLTLAAQPVAASCGGVTTVGNETALNTAIAAFNADTASSSCVFTIQLADDIALTNSTTPIQNVISGKSMIIEGAGHRVTGQALADVRPFYVMSGTTVTVNDLTVTDGKLTGTGVSNRGGAILNQGTLTLNRSTLARNSVEGNGGGIANHLGTLLINRSTIAENTSGLGGGGVDNDGGTVTVRNSTLSGNEAQGLSSQGGGIRNTYDLTLDSVTITENGADEGGGVFFSTTAPRTLTIKNTILAGNGFGDCYFRTTNNSAKIVDQGYNLVQGDDQLHPCGFVNGVNNNIVAVPLLEPLADNGGPTQTHALSIASPAIDHGSTALATDQRGVPRPAGAAADIGAYESLACDDSAWSVTSFSELNAAITCFNAKTATGTYTYTISITHGFPAFASTTAINNSTSGVNLVIEGNNQSVDWNGETNPGTRPFLIEAGSTVTINDFSITGGKVQGSEPGGGIRNSGNLTINRSTISGNSAESNGGGIRNDVGAVMVINDSTISGNELQGGTEAVVGGGIANGGNLTIRNSTVSGNTSSNDGGGIESFGSLNLDSVTVTNNTALGADLGARGAGVFIGAFGTLTSRNSILAGNLGGEDCFRALFPVTDGGHNLVKTQASDFSSCFTDGVNGTIVGQDPLLGTLRNNGGPTRTHALLPGSPAIDAGNTDLTTDQRGQSRPAGPADDIGAFEEAQLGTITVVKATYAPDTTNFEFTLAGGVLPSPLPFKLDTSIVDLDSVNDRESFDLPAGTYTVTELGTGYVRPVSIACSDANGPIGNFSGNAATVPLAAYQNVTCTFTNAHVCDVTQDGSVSKADILNINGRLRSTVAVGTMGDINSDGKITTQDTRGCSLQCTLPNCAEPTTAP